MRAINSISSSKRRTIIFFTSLAFLSFVVWMLPSISHASLQQAQPQKLKPRKAQTVPGEILVRFKTDAEPAIASSKRGAEAALAIEGNEGQLAMRIERLGGREIVPGLRLARVSPDQTQRAIEVLRKRADVLYAEPNYIRRKADVPNDPRYPQMWGLNNTGQSSTSGGNPGKPGNDIRAEQAWSVTRGSRSVVVGIVDEGIDINHEDLRDNIWTNPGEVAGNNIDDDGNGLVDDINGWDFAHNDASVFDYTPPSFPPDQNYSGDFDDHGTHVAGTIGATGNNGIGVVGVNWQVSLMSLKFLVGEDGQGNSADLLEALAYAKMMRELWASSNGTKGANLRVLNNSYGGGGYSQAEFDAIRALGDAGILFIAAAGNEGLNNDMFPTYPSSYLATNIISVAASTGGGTKASFSNFGPGSVHITAPGEHILSTTPRNTYDFYSGTSMSTPHVTGSAALALSAFPNISTSKLRSLLLYSGFVATWQYIYDFPISTGRSVDVNGVLQGVNSSDTTPPGAISNTNFYNQSFPIYGFSFTSTGDDGDTGKIAGYEIRYSDTQLTDPAKFDVAIPLPAPVPDIPHSNQNATGRLPWRHSSGFIGVRAIDEVGNAGPILSIPVSMNSNVGDPYSVTESAATPLSTGGAPLGLHEDDEYKQITLPFSFKFYDEERNFVTVSTNGALYFGFPPNEDFLNSPQLLKWIQDDRGPLG